MTNNHPFSLSSNALKIVAAFSMVLDHVGYLFFPKIALFRIFGRLAFPIFAYFIAEGCFYTRNKLQYFLRIFVLGAVCQGAYTLATGDFYIGVLPVFSFSVLLIFLCMAMKKALTEGKFLPALGFFFLSGAMAVGYFFLCQNVSVDYGFFGWLLPLFAALPRLLTSEKRPLSPQIQRLFMLLSFAVGLVLLAFDRQMIQFYGLLALPFLGLYNGQRGKWKMKYFFYLFYPLHLLILEGLHLLLAYL